MTEQTLIEKYGLEKYINWDNVREYKEESGISQDLALPEFSSTEFGIEALVKQEIDELRSEAEKRKLENFLIPSQK